MKYTKEIVIGTLLLIILLMFNCNDSSESKVTTLQQKLEHTLSTLGKLEKDNTKLFDSLKEEDKKKDLKIAELKAKEKITYTKIAENKIKTEKKVKDIQNYTFKQAAEFLNNRYNTNKVGYTETATTLQDSTHIYVVEELAEKDGLEQDCDYYREIIQTKEEENKVATEKVNDRDITIEQKDKEKALLKSAFEQEVNISQEYKKENKKLKTNNFLDKVYIGVGATLGYLIGKKL